MYSVLNLLLSPNTTIVSFLILFGLLCFMLLIIPSISYNLFRIASLSISFIPLFWSIWLWFIYDSAGNTFQCVCNIESLHISFGIDAVGLSLVILTTALFPLCIMLMRTVSGILTFLLLEWVILGSLLILDLLGFYLFFESSLILLYLLIGRYSGIVIPTIVKTEGSFPRSLVTLTGNEGTQLAPLPGNGSNNYTVKHSVGDYSTIDAAYKIVLYTMVGSLLFLPVIFILYSNFGSTNLFVLTCSNTPMLSVNNQMILGWGLLAVFAVKIPLIPVHLWLPEAHVAAPTAGSVLLAGVLLKLGGLGIIRYLIPIFPVFIVKIFPFIAVMCIISFLFSTLTTLRQVDMKKIVAYSSIAHMALVTLAIFSLSEHSVSSSTFMMIAHGLVSPALFLLVGFLYERSHTKYLPYLTGLGSHMPIYATLFFLLTLANLSFPLFPNFIAEVLCLLSLFAVHSLYAYIFCISQVLGSIYAFWTFNRVMHGYNSMSFNVNTSFVDLSRKETTLILPFIIGIFWLGLKPMA
jgi:proton-translocating NADH-quinone oxidoreductase chain M